MSQKKDNPFAVVYAINKGNPEGGDNYVPHITNKAFAGWYDTVMYANIMNQNYHLDPDIQHQFYLSVVKPRFRKNNWLKKQEAEDLSEIQSRYGVNERIARLYSKIKGERA